MKDAEGPAYIVHLFHVHDRLDHLLREIGKEVANLNQAGQPEDSFAQVGQRLADLRQQLQAHFAEEEAGGCLEEAVSRCPRLGVDSNAILAEHPLLDQMLEQLLVQTRNSTAPPADVQKDFQVFAERLRAHESAENRLLQMAFGAETADYDVENAEGNQES
jgi:hypothetical protein